jgi:uncharacterized protein
MKLGGLIIAACTLALAHAAAAAQAIDCATPIAKAQKSVDKITGDLQGMDKMMAKKEMSHIHSLVEQAEKLLKEAREGCAKTTSPYAQARGIARADAADGYATAADILHFHYMEAMSGSVKRMPAGGNSGTPKSGMPGMQNMNDMPGKR